MKIMEKIIKISFLLISLILISTQSWSKTIVAIDAGHGGKDSGAIGQKKLYEKTVTIDIAKKLTALINKDPQMHAVLTRSNDTFISVPDRSEIARQKKANLLISIHADSAPNTKAKGASIWVLSTKRSNSELGEWLEKKEQQSQLLGGAGNALSESKNPYLDQTILDLQFDNSKKVGYELASSVLNEMQKVVVLHKQIPELASLGVLRSPDIPSILIEVGFISNLSEEKLLRSNLHRTKIAQAIYKGLKSYVKKHPISKGKQ